MKLPRLALSLLAASVVATSLAGGSAVQAIKQNTGYQGTITFFADTFSPPSATAGAASTNGTAKHYALQTITNQWEKLHPGIQVKFIAWSRDPSTYATILRTRLIGGTAPDIFFNTQSDWGGFLSSKLIADLTPYLMQPDKYVPGNKHWNDIFVAPWQTWANQQGTSGKFVNVPLDLVATGVFYNKSITDKLGIRIPPASWAEFVADQAKIQSAGDYALYGPSFGLGSPGWYFASVAPVLMLADSKYATLTYQPGYVPGVVTTEDWARAVTKLGYRPSKDQGFIDTMTALKAWSQYWAPGWASDQSGDTKALQLFQSGRLAFMWEGSWVVPQLAGFHLPFKYGSFWFPPVTSATSKQVTAPMVPFGVGGYGAHNYMVMYKDSLDPTKMAAIVDYLQYITTPQHDAAIVNESPQFIPSVVGAKGDPAIAALFGAFAGQVKYAGQTPSSPYECMWVPDGQDQFNRALTSYLQGAESQASLLALADSLDVSGAQKFIAANDMSKVKGGTWNLTKW